MIPLALLALAPLPTLSQDQDHLAPHGKDYIQPPPAVASNPSSIFNFFVSEFAIDSSFQSAEGYAEAAVEGAVPAANYTVKSFVVVSTYEATVSLGASKASIEAAFAAEFASLEAANFDVIDESRGATTKNVTVQVVSKAAPTTHPASVTVGGSETPCILCTVHGILEIRVETQTAAEAALVKSALGAQVHVAQHPPSASPTTASPTLYPTTFAVPGVATTASADASTSDSSSSVSTGGMVAAIVVCGVVLVLVGYVYKRHLDQGTDATPGGGAGEVSFTQLTGSELDNPVDADGGPSPFVGNSVNVYDEFAITMANDDGQDPVLFGDDGLTVTGPDGREQRHSFA